MKQITQIFSEDESPIKTNIKGTRFEFYKKQQFILGAAAERCSGSICLEVNCQACNSTLRAFLRILVTSF